MQESLTFRLLFLIASEQIIDARRQRVFLQIRFDFGDFLVGVHALSQISANVDEAHSLIAADLAEFALRSDLDEVRKRNKADIRPQFQLVQGRQRPILLREPDTDVQFIITVIGPDHVQFGAARDQLNQRADRTHVCAEPTGHFTVHRNGPVDAGQGTGVVDIHQTFLRLHQARRLGGGAEQ